MIFLDFSKVGFDTVDHDISPKKISACGVRGNALSWFENYWEDRRQFVTYNGVLFDTKILQCGVPQGSILGALTFIIYINDLADVCDSSFLILFGDESNLFNHGKGIFSLEVTFNQQLAKIQSCLKLTNYHLIHSWQKRLLHPGMMCLFCDYFYFISPRGLRTGCLV